ncbi:hypothetical protein ACLOJK_014641 [Asimina triloba]
MDKGCRNVAARMDGSPDLQVAAGFRGEDMGSVMGCCLSVGIGCATAAADRIPWLGFYRSSILGFCSDGKEMKMGSAAMATGSRSALVHRQLLRSGRLKGRGDYCREWVLVGSENPSLEKCC